MMKMILQIKISRVLHKTGSLRINVSPRLLTWRQGFVFASLLLLTACSATVRDERSDSRPMPAAPHAAPVAPQGVHADRLALQVVPKPRDTDGNGFPDLIELYAYLFSSEHPTPFYEDGTLVFDIYFRGQSGVPGAEPIKTWRIGGEALDAFKAGVNIIGPHYAIQLSMLEGVNGTDKYPLLVTDLTARFEPADGRPAIIRRDVHRLQIGSATASR